jgi:hypothetical protein
VLRKLSAESQQNGKPDQRHAAPKSQDKLAVGVNGEPDEAGKTGGRPKELHR